LPFQVLSFEKARQCSTCTPNRMTLIPLLPFVLFLYFLLL